MRGRLAAHELDPARRAAGVAAAGVQDVDPGVLLDREHEALAILDINSGKPFNGQLRHARYVNVSSPTCPTCRRSRDPRNCGNS